MRCKACDKILEDSEAVKKDYRGDFYDLCNVCLNSVYKYDLCLDDSLDYSSSELFSLEDI